MQQENSNCVGICQTINNKQWKEYYGKVYYQDKILINHLDGVLYWITQQGIVR